MQPVAGEGISFLSFPLISFFLLIPINIHTYIHTYIQYNIHWTCRRSLSVARLFIPEGLTAAGCLCPHTQLTSPAAVKVRPIHTTTYYYYYPSASAQSLGFLKFKIIKPTHETHAHEMHACKMYAHKAYSCKVYACEMH
jgi:hypothetical protein